MMRGGGGGYNELLTITHLDTSSSSFRAGVLDGEKLVVLSLVCRGVVDVALSYTLSAGVYNQ